MRYLVLRHAFDPAQEVKVSESRNLVVMMTAATKYLAGKERKREAQRRPDEVSRMLL